MSSPICPCVCGADLEAGRPEGIWTLGGVAVEYRTCVSCSSTRAFMPADVVAGRHIALYRDELSSEVQGEWTSLLEALESHPYAGATLMRNGNVLARVVVSPVGGEAVWKVSGPLREVPVRV